VIAFLDASALIYLIEGQEPWVHHAKTALSKLNEQTPNLNIALSRLSWLECRLGPLRRQAIDALDRFDSFFSRPDLIWVELNAAVIELATELRADHGLRTPDALQAACCLQLGAEAVLISGDAAFQGLPSLNTVIVGRA